MRRTKFMSVELYGLHMSIWIENWNMTNFSKKHDGSNYFLFSYGIWAERLQLCGMFFYLMQKFFLKYFKVENFLVLSGVVYQVSILQNGVNLKKILKILTVFLF